MLKKSTLSLLFVLTVSSIFAQTETSDDRKVEEYITFKNGLLAFTKKQGVYFSLDTGQTWTPVNKGLSVPNYCWHRVIIDSTVVINFNNHVYTMNNLEDGWILRENGFTDSKQVDNLQALNGKLFSSTWDGLFSSTDKGATWAPVNKFPKDRISDLISSRGTLLVSYFKDNEMFYFSSIDGEKWNSINMGDLKGRSDVRILKEGNFLTANWCRQENNNSGGRDCKVNLKWILSADGKKWEAIEIQPRGFWVYGDLIYAVNGKPVRNGNKYTYIFNILQSDNRGKSWVDVTGSMEEILAFDNSFSKKVQQIYDAQKTELADYQMTWKTVDAYSKEVKAERKAMINAVSGNPLKYCPPFQVYDGSKYRDASNDRFKERNNQRDTWIDSGGRIHSPKR